MKRLKVADLTTTVLTMTPTGLAADSPLGGGKGKGSSRRTAAVVAMLIGAIAGALLLKVHLAAVLGLAALLTILTHDQEEVEANRFAAAPLMPEILVHSVNECSDP